MPRAQVGDVELEYEVHGQGQPLLLIMGIGAQMILWHEDMVGRFVDRGFQVVRFDNRDVGHSTWLDDAPVPDPRAVIARAFLGLSIDVPYTLSDMARDAVGLIDHLGWQRAHVVGASMGGMVAQHVAIEHSHRVASLTSLMSTTGGRLVSLPKPKALRALLGRRATTALEAEQYLVDFMQAVSGPTYPQEETHLRELARRSWERGANPKGFLRQLGAIMASGDRTEHLRQLKIPTLVMHGTSDPLVPPRGGRATAAAVPDARLHLIDGWGHGMPRGVWDQLVEHISTHAHANPVITG